MGLRTIRWKHNAIILVDQTRLPAKLVYVRIKNVRELWQAIRSMKIRGAPALGGAAALGVYLGIKDSKAKTFTQFSKDLDRTAQYLASSRPTARNLFWAIERVLSIAIRNKAMPVKVIKGLLLREALKVIEEDRTSCRAIGAYGAKLIKGKERILTICNAGILATIDFGTALGVVYSAYKTNKKLKVFACETRPMLQGARLTAWELVRKGVEVTLICDNMAATLMQQGLVDCVIAGADRIAANGDAANKIGTYNLAVLARYHKLPFYIAAPSSTFDTAIMTGKDIPIEERNPEEVTELFFKKKITAEGVKVFNPAFDVTPHNLITAIITDRGIIRPSYQSAIKRILHAGK